MGASGKSMSMMIRVLALAVVAACGTVKMGGGIAGTSSIEGPISGFGSILVNGIELDVSSASITIEGDPVSAADLRLGMVTQIRGVVLPGGRRGTAEIVAVNNLVEGPLESIDIATGTLGLMGQTIRLAPTTVVEPTALEDLRVGDFVDVGGFFDANQAIRASRVEHVLEDPELEVRGTIADLDTAAQTFRLAGLFVEYADALIEDAPPGGLANGLYVEVDADDPPVAQRVTAVEVTVIDPTLLVEPGDGVDIDGFVTAILDPDVFVVNGSQTIRLTPDTRYRNGTRESLALDSHVEVDGFADAQGVVNAREVEFDR